jgi:hypothetical protein
LAKFRRDCDDDCSHLRFCLILRRVGDASPDTLRRSPNLNPASLEM